MTVRPSYLPDPAQAALLRACLFEGEEARTAFYAWRDAVDLDAIDGASIRLLPLLASRLAGLGIDDAQVGKYRGVQRLAWAQNQMLLKAARPLVGALASAGIQPLLLKGAALSTSIYPSLSMRPMGDLDLMVPQLRVGEAAAIFTRAGWKPFVEPPASSADYAFQHALGFAAPAHAELEIDLHWRLFPWHSSAEAETAMFANAEALPAFGPAALTLSPADMLLHVCAHGTRWNPLPPIRWIADATMILRRRAIDWGHLVAQCERLRLVLPMRAAFDYLAVEMRAEIPPQVRATLEAIQVQEIDRITFAVEQASAEQRAFLPYCRLHLHRAGAMVGKSPLALWRYASRIRADRGSVATLRWLWQRAIQ